MKPKNKSLFPRAYLVDGPILTFSDILTHFIRTPKPVADSSSTLEESRGAEIYHYTTAKVMASQYLVVNIAACPIHLHRDKQVMSGSQNPNHQKIAKLLSLDLISIQNACLGQILQVMTRSAILRRFSCLKRCVVLFPCLVS